MKYFIDTEFHEYKKDGINTIELISIGVVREDGANFYTESRDFNMEMAVANEWLNENVIKNLMMKPSDRPSNDEIAIHILKFIGEDSDISFYGYFADYDWVVFCWLFGRMIDLPKGFPMYCRDLKQMLDECYVYQENKYEGESRLKSWLKSVKSHPDYPKQQNEHNALADAIWNAELYKFISQKKFLNSDQKGEKSVATM